MNQFPTWVRVAVGWALGVWLGCVAIGLYGIARIICLSF